MDRNAIKLLNVVTNYEKGGTEGQVYNLVSRLNRSAFDVEFVCLNEWGHYLELYRQLQIPITEFKIRSFAHPSTLSQQLKFARFVRSQKIQIVHSYNYYSNVFALPAAKLAGVPAIFASIRDRGVYLTPAQKKLQKWACKFADRILVNADSIEEWLLEDGYPADKISVIKNGIDLKKFEDPLTEEPIRKIFNIPEDAPLVVMASRLNYYKGVDDFIEAAASVSKMHPDAHFMLVGGKLTYSADDIGEDTVYIDQLKALVDRSGLAEKLIFTGTRDDVPAIFAAATLSVLPSHNEGLSNTLLESMAAGLPVVSSDVGGSPELIKDGINGILVPKKAPKELAEAINKLLADPQLAQQYGDAGRQRARQHHCIDQMVETIEELYRQQLGGSQLRTSNHISGRDEL